MNRYAFLELADRIELEDRFDLGFYATRTDRVKRATTTDLTTDCGTVGCVAGWACALAGRSHASVDEREIWEDASSWLGIDLESARRLFYADRGSVWARMADDLGLAVRDDECDYGSVDDWSQITAVQASKVLRMIADGEVEL